MKKIKDIESAVKNLSDDDLIQFRSWFESFDAHYWDNQFEQDVLLGRLDNLAQKAVYDFNQGQCKEL